MLRNFSAVALSLIAVSAPAAPHRDKFRRDMTERLRKDHKDLKALRVSYEMEPGYLLSEDAYRHAISDLEDFGIDPAVTEERLRNDVRELEFDLHELADTQLVPVTQ